MKKQKPPLSHAAMVKSGKFAHKSKAENPVQLVWELASANPKLRRRDIINLCLAKGVAFYTARTQYQLWRAAGLRDEAAAKKHNESHQNK
jgi:hypothetical protein